MIGTHSEDTDDGSSHFGNLFYHKLVLETAEETDQIANICWIMEKAREFQKNIYFCFIDYANVLDCVNLNKL